MRIQFPGEPIRMPVKAPDPKVSFSTQMRTSTIAKLDELKLAYGIKIYEVIEFAINYFDEQRPEITRVIKSE